MEGCEGPLGELTCKQCSNRLKEDKSPACQQGNITKDMAPPPPPPCPDMGHVLVQGAKVWKHGVAVCGQACVTARHAPQKTCCTHISQPFTFMTTKGCPTGQHTPRAREHMGLQLHQPIDIHIDLSWSLNKATNWIGTGKTMGSKQPTSAETRGRRVCTSPCSGKWGGGVLVPERLGSVRVSVLPRAMRRDTTYGAHKRDSNETLKFAFGTSGACEQVACLVPLKRQTLCGTDPEASPTEQTIRVAMQHHV